ncbi:cyclin-like protein [Ascodesmis nigricans]|uniref:RNA polymerase II holoenzyme cyclin-like subunit n=1 Tax=Ascodesmis nigricans TaxID=341454 RepID=A0A4S2N8L1_9PEZI|nr:cyclin-like protein [Ascodesmis nigricans]
MASPRLSTPVSPPPALHPSTVETYNFANTFIQRARPYLTSSQIDGLRPRETTYESGEISVRLSACSWMLQVGRVLLLPIRTITTGMVMFHRLVLFNNLPGLEHNWTEAAAAALFSACKIEDTLKKSREILAVSYNIRHPQSNPINHDNLLLDDSHKRVLGMERMILETASFDFRSRHAQPFLIKLCRKFQMTTELAHRAWNISIDAYRTLAPMQATPHVVALASIVLATRLEGKDIDIPYHELEAKRDDVLSVVDDLLELYTYYSPQTLVGPQFDNNVYLNIRIDLNQERKQLANGHSHANHKNTKVPKLVSTIIQDRGTSGAIRFMIDPEREKRESSLLEGAPDGAMGRMKEVMVSMVNGVSPPP